MQLVLIPTGEFLMGSPQDHTEAHDWEKPQHTVRITKPFYLGVTEVTQEQYERVTGQNRSHFKGDPQRPVDLVSWEDAVAFSRKLSEKEGQTYRLPTEAEWEYACRAGTQTRFGFGDDYKDLGEYAWYYGNSRGATHPVGRKKPNAWGLFDMYGNVGEWCADQYDPKYYESSPQDDPPGPTGGANPVNRVHRGGNWRRDKAYGCRAPSRGWLLGPGYYADGLGFRPAKEFPASSK
jgi:formylglycine-generating enzyme required for sulfatase activity